MDKEPGEKSEKHIVPTVSEVLEDGTIIELIYRPERRSTHLGVFNSGRWTVRDHVDLSADIRAVPFSPNNNLIKNEVILFPSEPRIYESEQHLVSVDRGFHSPLRGLEPDI